MIFSCLLLWLLMTYVSTGRSHAKWRRGKFYQVIPVCHLPVFDGSLDGEDPPSASGFIPNIGILLSHPHHDCVFAEWSERKGRERERTSSMSGTAHSVGKHSSRCIITSKTLALSEEEDYIAIQDQFGTCFHHIFTTIKDNGNNLFRHDLLPSLLC